MGNTEQVSMQTGSYQNNKPKNKCEREKINSHPEIQPGISTTTLTRLISPVHNTTIKLKHGPKRCIVVCGAARKLK